jgi:hypothetical protein
MRLRLSLPARNATTRLPLVLAIIATMSGHLIATEPNREKAKASRQEALAKQRRVIFNDDTHELQREDANTPEGFLSRRLAPLAGTHVDVIAWSVLGGWSDAPVYDSKVQPLYGDAQGKPPAYTPGMAENVKALIQSGHCPLQSVIDLTRANSMETFASVRMNDCHDSFISGGKTLWKKEHPEFWVDGGDVPHDLMKHPLGLYWTAQDFTHQEVRDRKFEIIEEVCQRYDIDGIHLNFMRHPVFFSRTMRGEPVTAEELKIMTGLIRRIRQLADEQGTERGRPILVAVIVPDSLQLAKNVGLDVETWIEDDLIDIVVPGLGYTPFTVPVKEFVDLAHPYGVKVYPCINRQAPQTKQPEELVSEGFRGVAAKWYAAGADGIFFWNLGTPFEPNAKQTEDEIVEVRSRYYAALPELGSPRALRGKDKLFSVDNWVLSHYQHVSSRPPLPVDLKPGESEQVTLAVADDLQTAARDGSLSKTILTMEFEGPAEKENLALRLNGKDLAECQAAKQDGGPLRISCALEASQVKQGKNVVEATLKKSLPDGDKAVRLSKIRLLVRYNP